MSKVKIYACAPLTKPGDVIGNMARHAGEAGQAAALDAGIIAFPELSALSVTAGDVITYSPMREQTELALSNYMSCTRELPLVSLLGVPVWHEDKIYSCAAVISGGKLLGLVPKKELCDRGLRCDSRIFDVPPASLHSVEWQGEEIPFGTGLRFDLNIGEGLRLAVTPGETSELPGDCDLAIALCALPEYVGSLSERKKNAEAKSRKAGIAYLEVNAGEGESTGDAVYGGSHVFVLPNGEIIAKTPLSEPTYMEIELDTDYSRIASEDMPQAQEEADPALPFIPSDGSGCDTVLDIQVAGLCARMKHTGAKAMVLGISGGLDSTMALLCCALAADKLGISRESVIAVTMPCFGTTTRTRGNAERMAELLHVTLKTVDIKEAVTVHLRDIGHAEGVYDAAYENAQARERTQILMDMANIHGGLVIGTGDLSELALGWATYNGDHMSMYCLNGSVPKTLMCHVLGVYAHRISETQPGLAEVLRDVLDTPISPELLPADGDTVTQPTELLVGPYVLHDFFIWHLVYKKESPAQVLTLAQSIFDGHYDAAVIENTLATFLRRFFTQQFKRSCMPDGPMVTPVSLSPRGGLRMPSDCSGAVWQTAWEAEP